MAQQVTTAFVDDLDGSVAEGTVAFALDRKSYDIDLSASNAAKLRDILAPYVGAARRAGRNGQAVRRTSARATDRDENQAIREWAQAEGLSIAARGRISSGVMEAYRNRDAQPAAPEPVAEESTAATEKKPRRRATAKAAAE